MGYRVMLQAMVVMSVLGMVSGAATAQDCSGGWVRSPDQGFRGTSNDVFGTTTWDPDGPGPEPEMLVVVGSFSAAGHVATQGVALWSASTGWRALPFPSTAWIRAATVFEGDLVVGGEFSTVDGVPYNLVARWDGKEWRPFASGLASTGSVRALAVHAGELYAGGIFSSTNGPNYIARWDGTAWQPLGTGLPGGSAVHALASHNGELVVGGSFTTAGGTAALRIARWNGTTWRGIGFGFSGPVYAVCVYNGELIATGQFSMTGAAPVSFIARWNGTNWQPLGGGLGSTGTALGVHDGRLIAAGSFQSAGGVPAMRIAAWDGAAWSALAGGVTAPGISTLRSLGGDLFVGGSLTSAGGVDVTGVARWDGHAWHAMGGGFNDRIDRLSMYRGKVVASGPFTSAGAGRAAGMALWDGASWQPLDAPLTGDVPTVLAMAEHRGELVVAGRFDSVAGLPAANIVRWSGPPANEWRPLGEGVTGRDHNLPVIVSALAVYEGDLIAGGTFLSAGGVPVSSIARWDGKSWHALDAGVAFQAGFAPQVMAMYLLGSELVVGGRFDLAGGQPAPTVARWNGQSWSAMGAGLPGSNASIYDFAFFEGSLFAVGSFDNPGGGGRCNVARWDGSAWLSVPCIPGSQPSTIFCLEIHAGSLFAGGFYTTNSTLFGRLVRWTGSSWTSVGGEVNYAAGAGIYGMVAYQEELIVAGRFHFAGDQAAAHWARWNNTGTPWLVTQPPASSDPCRGGSVTLSVATATGYEVSYRWRRDALELQDGPAPGGSIISGAGTDRVVIENISVHDAGVYDCSVATECAGTTSEPSLVAVCIADYDCDGVVSSQDFFGFLDAFLEGDADVNADGATSSQDFFDFLSVFFEGCE